MHELVYSAAMIWMTGLLCGCVVLVIRTGSTLVRILALDSLTLILIALLEHRLAAARMPISCSSSGWSARSWVRASAVIGGRTT